MVSHGTAAPPGADTDLLDRAIELAGTWRDAAGEVSRHQARTARRLTALLEDPAGFEVATGFLDRVTRATGDRVAAEQLADVVDGRGIPRFLSVVDRVLFAVGGRVAPVAPAIAMPLARARLRQLVGHLVVDADPDALAARLAGARADGQQLNINLLGEAVLGEREARRRLERTLDLVARPDVDHVSVKITGIAAQLNPWAFDAELERISDRLRQLYLAAAATDPPTFVNLDLEEHRDLELSLEAFTRLLDEPALQQVEAGIVLQAYLPDSVAALQRLTSWAGQRRASGGAPVRIRLVKGANLAMERVEAELHGWPAAPYPTKADTDANYKRLVDLVLDPTALGAVKVGIASHNLFDVAWALLLAEERGVADHVRVEMLQGMAPGEAAAVGRRAGELRLYTPVVARDDFDVAISYLFRRLEETSAPENFLRALPHLISDPSVFDREAQRFVTAVGDRHEVSAEPRRTQDRRSEEPRVLDHFVNEPDTDPSLPGNRAWAEDVVATPPAPLRTPIPADVAEVDRLVSGLVAAQPAWHARGAAARREVLHAVAAELSRQRGELVRVMVHEAGKTVGEADPEVSEAIDFARYYAERAPELEAADGLAHEPLGVVLVTPPWNFPVAIPAGGVLASLAAGNAVVFKPAPETRRCAELVAEACWAAGVPEDVLRFFPCEDDEVGRALVSHGGLGGIVLTGASETARMFRTWNPDVPLMAETSGKNALIISPAADLDLAVADLVRSAFGHAGQKCSAASLAICIGDIAEEPRFLDQLVDAVESLVVGPSTDLATTVGPVIHAPEDKLERALTRLEPGERWLVEPRQLSEDGRLWSPGVRVGVTPGSWTHTTEWFGPVLGIVRAADLDEAIAIQNATGYGLTGGIHSLDDREVERWLAKVQVGNAYVNRHITGAIVQRQPFGGWKRSSVGPGAKAGGPNYVAQLGTWREEAPPTDLVEPGSRVAALLAKVTPILDPEALAWVRTAAASDEHAWRTTFGVEHDPTGLRAEANVLRYRPRRRVVVRVGPDASDRDVARVVLAAVRSGSPVELSSPAPHPCAVLVDGEAGHVTVEDAATLVERTADVEGVRVRVVGELEPELHRAAIDLRVDVLTAPVVAHGRVELHHHLLEQAISRTLHRYGVLRDDR